MTWQDNLSDNGIMMREVDVADALIEGVAEKAAIVDITPTISISALDGCGFCSSLDANITTIAPSFVDSNNSAYSSDLGSLCSAAGYETVVYGATPGSVVLQNGGVQFSAEYVAQRRDILALFTDPAATITLPTSYSVVIDTISMNKTWPIIQITPEGAYDGIVVKYGTTNYISYSDGVITILTQNSGKKISITCDKDESITYTYNTAVSIYKSEPEENILGNLIRMYAGNTTTYTQNGLTLTYNDDGTCTLRGKSTAGNTSYQRFVIWPIGNNKNVAYNHLVAAGSGVTICWLHPVEGDINEDDSTLISNNRSKNYEAYWLSSGSQYSYKVEHYNDSGTARYCTRDFDETRELTTFVLGIQVKNGSDIDFTFAPGVLKRNSQCYNAGILEEHLVPKSACTCMKKNTSIIVRLSDGSFEIFSSSTSIYNLNLHYTRITKVFVSGTNAEALIASGEEAAICEAGHTYKFTVVFTQFTVNITQNTAFSFYLAASNTTRSFHIIDPSVYTEDQTSVNMAGTYETTFTTSVPYAYFGIHTYDLGVVDKYIRFNIELIEITE